jgi:rubredoxin
MEKSWRCTVCGYIHTGDEPPDICPVCGVDASRFELVGRDEVKEAAEGEVRTVAPPEGSVEKRWRCTVCGYVHAGDEPPGVCPVCGVDAAKFELEGGVDDTVPQGRGQNPASSASPGPLAFALEMWETFVLHAVAAHFPNGLLPSAALFFALFFIKGSESLETTAFHLVALTVVVTPVVFLSGLRDWQAKFGGAPGGVFYKKIMLALIMLILGIAAVTLRGVVGSWDGLELWGQILYLSLVAGMLGCVTMLGHYGGQLVFMKHEK